MHLKTLTLKGFKSFPERTRLDFGPGVSVVVGPNGSGKSNITDAVLWAMGEQSPLAVRGQSMQDVIFGGAKGVPARSEAEVEIVLDNSDGTVELPVSEIALTRRLSRTGEGEYRLNGARCRLGDVLEVLSDTGLGKETHSVISQGRVETIVNSRPRERRLLIEEAAGLGKHRKRRRRAQLKLERTQENLDRALDIEREARTRLRPLKRQAEAAQLHERLERQILEARLELVGDEIELRGEELKAAQARASEARAARAKLEGKLQATGDRRAAAEKELSDLLARHETLARRVLRARAAAERLDLRSEQVRASAELLSARSERVSAQLEREEGTDALADDGAAELRAREESLGALQQDLSQVQASGREDEERELAVVRDALERAQKQLDAADADCAVALAEREHADRRLGEARAGRTWSSAWQEVRTLIQEGVKRAFALVDERERVTAADEVAARAERVAREAVELALEGVGAAEAAREEADAALRALEARRASAREGQQRAQWLLEQRERAPTDGPLAVRRAELEGAIAAQRQAVEHARLAQGERAALRTRLRSLLEADAALRERAHRLLTLVTAAAGAAAELVSKLDAELAGEGAAGERMAGELRVCASQEAEIQGRLRSASEIVTEAEVLAQRARDQLEEVELERAAIVRGLDSQAPAQVGVQDDAPPAEPDPPVRLEVEQKQALEQRVERLERRRELLGPVNPLAAQEYREAVAHVEELETRRGDLETAMRELRSLIVEIDRQIEQTFTQTFEAAARNFGELVGDLFPGGGGTLRLVRDEQSPRAMLGGASPDSDRGAGDGASQDAAAEGAGEPEDEAPDGGREGGAEDLLGVEIEITPAGKSTKRLSLLSGGEKSMTALAFLFAVFLARPCPFYILDEVEAALDDLNLDRFLTLLRRHCERAQFIVITHQKRTMEAADWLYGVSMGGDGVSKVLSRRLPPDATAQVAEVAEVA